MNHQLDFTSAGHSALTDTISEGASWIITDLALGTSTGITPGNPLGNEVQSFPATVSNHPTREDTIVVRAQIPSLGSSGSTTYREIGVKADGPEFPGETTIATGPFLMTEVDSSQAGSYDIISLVIPLSSALSTITIDVDDTVIPYTKFDVEDYLNQRVDPFLDAEAHVGLMEKPRTVYKMLWDYPAFQWDAARSAIVPEAFTAQASPNEWFDNKAIYRYKGRTIPTEGISLDASDVGGSFSADEHYIIYITDESVYNQTEDYLRIGEVPSGGTYTLDLVCSLYAVVAGFSTDDSGTPIVGSFWDLAYRPSSPSPFNMCKINNEWVDIYPFTGFTTDGTGASVAVSLPSQTYVSTNGGSLTFRHAALPEGFLDGTTSGDYVLSPMVATLVGKKHLEKNTIATLMTLYIGLYGQSLPITEALEGDRPSQTGFSGIPRAYGLADLFAYPESWRQEGYYNSVLYDEDVLFVNSNGDVDVEKTQDTPSGFDPGLVFRFAAEHYQEGP